MKYLTRKMLPLVLTLVTMGVLLTSALAARTDTLILSTYPDTGTVTVSENSITPFIVDASVISESGFTITDQYNISYSWTLDGIPVSNKYYYEFSQKMGGDSYTLVCTVSAIHKTDGTQKFATATWYPTTKNVKNIQLTVTQNIGSYYFDDTTTHSGTSVYNEIYQRLNLSSAEDLRQYEVTFIPNSSHVATFVGEPTCALTQLDQVYLSISSTGQWITQYTVTKNKVEVLTGLLTIDIEPYVGLDAFYSAAPGTQVAIDASVFSDFWYKNSSALSTLTTINITSVSGMSGVLCYNHTAAEKAHTSAHGLTMYASPTGRQQPIGDLTFVPNKTGNKYPTGTVTISFLASGTDQNKKPISIVGNIMILYTDITPSDINYNCDGTHVTLRREDFDAVYRSVTGTNTKNPVYTVRFLELPDHGTLYRGYSDANYGTLGSTALTEQNCSILSFYSNATGEASLDNLAYVPLMYNSVGDSARYAVYSGSKLLYVGTVNFTSRELIVTYTMSSPTLTFSSMDFFSGNSPLINAQYIMFGTPSSGALYKDYANGIYVQPRDYFSYSTAYGINLLDNVTFVPQEGFAGVVEIPFSAQALLGGSISGRVRIYVARDVFEDVDPNSWAAPYINRLYAAGIISGTSATTFSPNANMNYGAALKMILVAAGYPKQSETGGDHWASSYLDLAYRNGIVSSKNIDLNATVDRDTIAEIAAKALGMQMASSVNSGIVAPVDSTNGYVYALYNAGILNGSFVNGANYFQGNNPITRAEVAKIICAINDYSK